MARGEGSRSRGRPGGSRGGSRGRGDAGGRRRSREGSRGRGRGGDGRDRSRGRGGGGGGGVVVGTSPVPHGLQLQSTPEKTGVDSEATRHRRRPVHDSEVCEHLETELQMKACRQRLKEHLAALEGLRDRSDEALQLFSQCTSEIDDLEALLFFENEAERPVSELLLPDMYVVGPEGDSPVVSEGFLVLDFRPSVDQAAAAVARLWSCWWTLVPLSPKFSTLIFIAVPRGGLQETQRESFAELHQEGVLHSPAPLVFAAQCASADSASSTRSCPPRHSGTGKDAFVDKDHASLEKGSLEKGEKELIHDVAEFLGERPREVQELASMFAQRFNTTVRANPKTPYSPEGKNDGSFKKWLLSRGFVAGSIFSYNKTMFSLPDGGVAALSKTSSR